MNKKKTSDTGEVWPEWMSAKTAAKFLDMTPDRFRILYRTQLKEVVASINISLGETNPRIRYDKIGIETWAALQSVEWEKESFGSRNKPYFHLKRNYSENDQEKWPGWMSVKTLMQYLDVSYAHIKRLAEEVLPEVTRKRADRENGQPEWIYERASLDKILRHKSAEERKQEEASNQAELEDNKNDLGNQNI